MSEINLILVKENLINHEELAANFITYLRKVLKYNKMQAEYIAFEDFSNPYECPYIMQDYKGRITIDGREYEVRFCYTEFRTCGMYFPNKPPFEFYMLIDLATLPNTKESSYRDSRKLYAMI